jgi:ubiquinone/menaquinone biosynthesis C-methylase UbiE
MPLMGRVNLSLSLMAVNPFVHKIFFKKKKKKKKEREMTFLVFSPAECTCFIDSSIKVTLVSSSLTFTPDQKHILRAWRRKKKSACSVGK